MDTLMHVLFGISIGMAIEKYFGLRRFRKLKVTLNNMFAQIREEDKERYEQARKEAGLPMLN